MEDIIKTEELGFDYIRRNENGEVECIVRAVDDVNISIKKGEFVVILGANGSGKSTLAKHLNALLKPTDGIVWVDGMDTADDGLLWEVRRTAGMVFQNPDNQIIGQVVDEDVAFGPENLGVPGPELPGRVEESLKAVDIYGLKDSPTISLSGGQKQRVSIAGILAMHPTCIVLDEPTAMLDPAGRKEVMRALLALNDVEKITVIHITHNMDEAVNADRIIVMDHGKVALSGTPTQVFSRVEELLAYGLTVPDAVMLAYELRKAGIGIPEGIVTGPQLTEALINEYNH